MFKDCEGCTRVSDNKFFNCPPLMSDGRHFTDFRPRCFGQYMIKEEKKIPSSFDYRMYLTRNASEIMAKNALDAYQQNVCGPCMEPFNVGTMLPEYEMQTCNTRTCSVKNNDPAGLGLGRDNGFVDKGRQEFLRQKEKENEYFKAKANCCSTIQDDLHYYPIDGVVQTTYDRYSIPGGGVPLTGGDLRK